MSSVLTRICKNLDYLLYWVYNVSMSSLTIRAIMERILDEKEHETYLPLDKDMLREAENHHRILLRDERMANPAAALFKNELRDILKDKKAEFNEADQARKKAKGVIPPWLGGAVAELMQPTVDKLGKTVLHLKFLIAIKKSEEPQPMQGKLTDREIEAAKNHPIGNILEIRRGKMSLCPFHNDKRPSMYCKNNYAYCFVCGWKGDVIAVFMQLNKVDFVTAVKQLAYA